MQKNFLIITSPLDQFEIRNFVNVDIPILGTLHISIINIGLYLTITVLLAFYSSIIATNYRRIISNSLSRLRNFVCLKYNLFLDYLEVSGQNVILVIYQYI